MTLIKVFEKVNYVISKSNYTLFKKRVLPTHTMQFNNPKAERKISDGVINAYPDKRDNYLGNGDQLFPLDCLKIYTIHQPKIRLGKDYDGGYVILDGFSYDALIGCGISRDNSFENHFLKKYDVDCYAFDGTIEKLSQPNSKIKFIKKNISDKNTDHETNLFDLVETYNNLFLKMDIEASEYIWLQSIDENQLKKFKQIVIEFHQPFTKERWSCIQKLNKTHYLCHLHPNNVPGMITIDRITVPNVFECTYILKTEVGYKPTLNDSKIPSMLDMKNGKKEIDIYLDGYPYVILSFQHRLVQLFNKHLLKKEFKWKEYLVKRPDLIKNWNGPIRALVHYIFFQQFDKYIQLIKKK